MDRKFTVNFYIELILPIAIETLFHELVDWKSHASWVPLTKVEITKELAGFEGVVHIGQEFCARTGIGPFAFEDHMRVSKLDEQNYRCEVIKLGPLLTGRAGFNLITVGKNTKLTWFEEVDLPLPGLLSPALSPLFAALGKFAFSISLRKFARRLNPELVSGH